MAHCTVTNYDLLSFLVESRFLTPVTIYDRIYAGKSEGLLLSNLLSVKDSCLSGEKRVVQKYNLKIKVVFPFERKNNNCTDVNDDQISLHYKMNSGLG